MYPLLKREGLVNTQASEQLLGDGFVTDFDIPFALVVPRQMCITTVASAFPALAKQALSAAIYTFS